MSLISVLVGSPVKGTRIDRSLTKTGSTAMIFLDATLKENFDAQTEVTNHPIEDGADISDHVILKPLRLVIDGIISETPFTIEGQKLGFATSVAASIGQNVGGAIGGLAAGFAAAKSLAGVLQPKSITGAEVQQDEDFKNIPSENSRLRDAVNEFLNMRQAKQVVSIVTGLKQYKNFILVSFSVSRDQSTGQSINLHLEFQEIILAESKTVKIAMPKIKAALPKSDQGRKTPAEVTGQKGSIAKNLAKQFFGGG